MKNMSYNVLDIKYSPSEKYENIKSLTVKICPKCLYDTSIEEIL